MRRPSTLFLLCLIILALFLSGCGGGGSSPAQVPSKAQFAKQAALICEGTEKAIHDKLSEYVRAHPGSLNIHPEIARDRLVLSLARPLVERQAQKQAALIPPAGDEKKVSAIVLATETGIKEAAANPTATIAGTYREANRLAGEYGIPSCEIL